MGDTVEEPSGDFDQVMPGNREGIPDEEGTVEGEGASDGDVVEVPGDLG